MTSTTLFALSPIPAVAAVLVLIVAHAAFSRRLSKAHPELSSRYSQLFWRLPSEARTAALQTEVYARLHDPTTGKLLIFVRLAWTFYVVATLVSVAACLLSMMSPIA